MNSFFFLFIGIPAIEIFLLIKIGAKIGALTTISLIFLTALVGLYFAKMEGIKTIRTGVINLYQHKSPVYEIFSGASIAIAAFLLIIPGFVTDIFGFLLLIPFTRKVLINFLIRNNVNNRNKHNETLDGEIIEDKKDDL
tara:strand:- start:770 stop:1186 length:417 start_codon:yes stop_codon:yes gene_type:complete